MTVEHRIQRKLEEYFNELYEMDALGWKDIEMKTNALCAVAREIENLSWEFDEGDYYEGPVYSKKEANETEETEYRPRRINFRKENFTFWKGFMDFAYRDPEFAAAFKNRRPEDKQWLTFHWTLPGYQTFRVYYNLTIEDNEIIERKVKIEGRISEETQQLLLETNSQIELETTKDGCFASVTVTLPEDRDAGYAAVCAEMISLRNILFGIMQSQSTPSAVVEELSEEDEDFEERARATAPDQEFFI